MQKIYDLLEKLIVAAAFIIMIIFPKITLQSCSEGLNLWFSTVIPSLLPSIIISEIIVSAYGKCFKNPYIFIIFAGLTCGYPVGAKTSVHMGAVRNLPVKVLEPLTAIINLSSPLFIINYVVISKLKAINLIPIVLIIVYLPIIIMLLLWYFKNHKLIKQSSVISNYSSTNHITFAMIDSAIANGIEILLKLGGYIILFSVISGFVCVIAGNYTPVIASIMEITTGINLVTITDMPVSTKLIIICSSLTFGGLSCCMQTMGIILRSPLSIKKYIYYKFLITALTAVIGVIVIYVCNM